MFEPLFKLLNAIFSLGNYRDPFVALCLDHRHSGRGDQTDFLYQGDREISACGLAVRTY
jgi:hypothetical protein